MDRRALIIGSWLAQGRDRPSPQRVRSLTDRWVKVFAEDRYTFRALVDPRAMPVPLHTPRAADLIAQLDDGQALSADTELLIYFVGHSVSSGENDVQLILGIDTHGRERFIALSSLLRAVEEHTPIRRLVVVLDTCHAGRTRETFRLIPGESFAMFATGDAYAFDAAFSDGLLRAFEQPLQKSDQRIDRRRGGITYRKVFEEARRRVLFGAQASQEPKCFGDYGDAVLFEAPASVPLEFNPFVSSRSIYGWVYRLLEIVQSKKPTFEELR